MKTYPVYVSGNFKAHKVCAPIHGQSETRWYGPVGEIAEGEYDGQKYRHYSPDRSQGLPQPSRDWLVDQGCV